METKYNTTDKTVKIDKKQRENNITFSRGLDSNKKDSNTNHLMKETKKKKSLNILTIDDEECIRMMFTRYLSSQGHAIKQENNGELGIERVKQEYFDIVLLDRSMPGMTGDAVLEEIKKISPNTKVIMISGNMAFDNDIEELKQKGAFEYLKKPFEFDRLDEVIKRVIDSEN